MENFISTLALLCIGLILKRIPQFPGSAPKTLTLYVIYVALPAVILVQVPRLQFNWAMLIPLVIPWLMLGLSAGLVLTVSHLLHWSKEVTGALMLIVPLGNTAFLGFPMVEAFWGRENLSYAVLYDQFGSFMALSTYGTFVLAAYGSAEKSSIRSIAVKIITFPPFIALLTALLLRTITIPPALTKSLELIAVSLVPVVMVAVGMQLELRMDRHNIAPFGVGLLIKLVIAPLAALAGCNLLGLTSMAAKVSVFEAGMPPMVAAGALALMAGLAPQLTAAMVGYGILFSFATLPVLYALMT